MRIGTLTLSQTFLSVSLSSGNYVLDKPIIITIYIGLCKTSISSLLIYSSFTSSKFIGPKKYQKVKYIKWYEIVKSFNHFPIFFSKIQILMQIKFVCVVETVKISLKFIYFLNSWTIIDEQFKPMSQLSSAMPILS